MKIKYIKENDGFFLSTPEVFPLVPPCVRSKFVRGTTERHIKICVTGLFHDVAMFVLLEFQLIQCNSNFALDATNNISNTFEPLISIHLILFDMFMTTVLKRLGGGS